MWIWEKGMENIPNLFQNIYYETQRFMDNPQRNVQESAY